MDWRVGTQRFPLDQCSVPLLLDRIKQSTVACKVRRLTGALCFWGTNNFSQEASVFFKKRAVLEDEYGRNLQKLARSTSELYAMSEGKAG